MNPFDYRAVQWAAIRALLVAFLLGGLFALSCGDCGKARAEDSLTITAAKWREVMSVLTARRVERDKALAEVKLLREQRRLDQNACASKLAAKDIELGKLRRNFASPSQCVGWQVGTGVAIGVAGICGAVLVVREVAKK